MNHFDIFSLNKTFVAY